MLKPFLTLLFLVLVGIALSTSRVADTSASGSFATATVDTLVAASSMMQSRAAHTATRLPDGRVLVAGGMTQGAAQPASAPDAELFDPATDSFVAAGRMRTMRQSHTATLLRDGRVLIAGGYDQSGAYLASTEIYDPATDRFVVGASLVTARAGHLAITLSDDRILLVGGVGTGWTILSSAEIFDAEKGVSVATGSMSYPRESHVGVRLVDGRVLIIGGHRGRRSTIELYSNTEIFEPRTGTFVRGPDMHARRHKHDAALLSDGRVLITGGSDERDGDGRYNSAEMIDAGAHASRLLAPMRLPRYKHAGTSILLPDGRVLIAGGATQAEIFEPANETFRLVAGKEEMFGQFSAAAGLSDGRVVVMGGYGNGYGAQAGAWVFRDGLRPQR